MKAAFRFAMIAVALVCGSVAPIAQQTQVTQKQLAEWITSGTAAEKDAALTYVSSLPPDRREPVLEDALMKELDRFSQERRKRFDVIKEGKPAVAEPEGQIAYRLAVTKAVSESIDPRVIPTLVRALGSDSGVNNALAKFGDDAAGPVSAAARAPHPDFGATSDALVTLRLILQSGQRLSKDSVAQISGAARDRLNGPQYFLNVIAAMDLAVATQDADLRRRVAQLSEEPLQVRQLGITDAAQARRVRDAALAALLR